MFDPPLDPELIPAPGRLPERVLYSTGARLGGHGLGSSSFEGAMGSHQLGRLGLAVAYGNAQSVIPRRLIRTVACHPVRCLSWIDRAAGFDAARKAVDLIAAGALARGGFDLFHGWSGDAFASLVEARRRGVPSMIEIPTWHRDKGRRKPFATLSNRQQREFVSRHPWRGWRQRCTIDRPRILAEYELVDLLLLQSRRAAESFIDSGVPEHKLWYVGRGVDPRRFQPAASPPDLFRLVFVGDLIERKGVHHLLRAWRSLALKDAELVLVGTVPAAMRPLLAEFGGPDVRTPGFQPDIVPMLQSAAAFVFPSECEGTAKATLEAAACGLPLISTREAGDAVIDQVNGLQVPANDPDALAAAIEHLHHHPERLPEMGRQSRQRVLERFTWDHYRTRVLHACAHLQRR